MCGITGLYSFDPRPESANISQVIGKMCDALAARGPDSDAQWIDSELPLALGHRRLSIIDLSPAGAQPMQSDSGQYVIVFNGEIYNYQAVKSELEQSGYEANYRGHSDTEILLGAIEHWGLKKAVEKINGMFAFALWDRKRRALFFARDRMGKKPLYIGWAGSTLVFASELKAICAHPEFKRNISRPAMTSYMRFGYVPAPYSIYNDILQIPAGHMMALDMQMLRSGQDLKPLMEPYWSHKNALNKSRKNPVANLDNVVDEFDEILSECVRERMISDVPLGAFLSGGIDSSTVVALMQKHSDSPVKTYSIGFDEVGYNEAEHAAEIARHLKTEHHELYVSSKDALNVVPKLSNIYDEPFADASAIPTYLVAKFAREGVTVALSGDGGDEMLGGYNRHIAGPKAWNIAQNIPPKFRSVVSGIIRTVPPNVWSGMRPDRPQFGSHMHKLADAMGKETQSDLYLSLVSKWQNPKRCVSDGYEDIIPLVDPEMQIEGLSFAEDMMYWDALSYLNGDILTKVDRASMAASMESRAPLLDTKIYDYVWSLPIDTKIKDGKGKWLLRQVLNKYVPQELYDRPKQGFSVPIDEWLRGPLKDWAEDLLDEYELKSQGMINYVHVRKLWQEHLKGRGNYADRLWCVLMFQSWHRQWITG